MAVCFAVFIAAIVACLILGRSILWGLSAGFAVFLIKGLAMGYDYRTLLTSAFNKFKTTKRVFLSFSLIGIVSGLWRSAGTIPFLLYYGLKSMPSSLFVLLSFFLGILISCALGSSTGTVGTIGVIIITIARFSGVYEPLVAGALISGAFFGGTLGSPVASCSILLAAVTGTNQLENMKKFYKIQIVPVIISSIVFMVLSLLNPLPYIDDSVFTPVREFFVFHWVEIIPVLFIAILPFVHVSIELTLTFSAVAAFLISVFVQHMPVTSVLKAGFSGFYPGIADLSAFSGGGFTTVVLPLMVVLIASFNAGILECIDALKPIKNATIKTADRFGLFPATALLSIVVASIFCNQSVTTIIDEQILSDIYKSKGASRKELAMDLGNSAVVLSGMIPWSVALTVPLQVTGTGIETIPFLVLMYMTPICYMFGKNRWLRAIIQ